MEGYSYDTGYDGGGTGAYDEAPVTGADLGYGDPGSVVDTPYGGYTVGPEGVPYISGTSMPAPLDPMDPSTYSFQNPYATISYQWDDGTWHPYPSFMAGAMGGSPAQPTRSSAGTGGQGGYVYRNPETNMYRVVARDREYPENFYDQGLAERFYNNIFGYYNAPVASPLSFGYRSQGRMPMVRPTVDMGGRSPMSLWERARRLLGGM